MRRLFVFLLVFLGAVLLAIFARQEQGHVMIEAWGWTLELTGVLAVGLLFGGFLLFHVMLRLLLAGARLPRRLRRWRRERRERRSLTQLEGAWAALLRGDWGRAERDMEAAGRAGGPGAMLAFLGAARAAHELGEDDRRDGWLRLAGVAAPDAELGLTLAQATMQIERAQFSQAAASLERLHGMVPSNPMVLRQRLRLFHQVGDWRQLLDLLPEARRRHLLNEAEMEALERQAGAHLLESPLIGDVDDLEAAWQDLPARARRDRALKRRYAQRLLGLGAVARAERVLREAIQRQWDPALVYLYGLVDIEGDDRPLQHAEKWRRKHGDDPVLLLTLGRLARRQALWGKALDHLKACVRAGGSPEAYAELALVHERMEKPAEALHYYRQAAQASMPAARMVDSAGGLDPAPGLLPPVASAALRTTGAPR